MDQWVDSPFFTKSTNPHLFFQSRIWKWWMGSSRSENGPHAILVVASSVRFWDRQSAIKWVLLLEKHSVVRWSHGCVTLVHNVWWGPRNKIMTWCCTMNSFFMQMLIISKCWHIFQSFLILDSHISVQNHFKHCKCSLSGTEDGRFGGWYHQML